VQNYSTRKLTYPSDRLPALSGIASEFGKLFTPKSYTLGIWKDDSLGDLLWMDDKSSASPAQQPDWSQVPSWSWASLNRPLKWHEACLENLSGYSLQSKPRACNIIEAEGSQLHQLILSGHLLTLGGVDIKYHSSYDSYLSSKTPHAKVFSFRFMLDIWYSDLAELTGKSGANISVSLIQSIYIMPVMYYEHSGDRLPPGVLGLSLIRAENSGNGIFRRVGVVNIFGKDKTGWLHRTVVPEKFPAAVRMFQQTLRQDDYIECDGESTYTIAII
jgi:hypothetical protein